MEKNAKEEMLEYFKKIKESSDTTKISEFYQFVSVLFEKFELGTENPEEYVGIWTLVSALLFKKAIKESKDKEKMKVFIGKALWALTEMQKEDKI